MTGGTQIATRKCTSSSPEQEVSFGCRAMGFMTSNSPSKDVFEVEGRDCLHKSKFSQPGEEDDFKHENIEVKARNIKLT